MEKYTGRQIRCGIGTDEQEWIAIDKLIKKIVEIQSKNDYPFRIGKLVDELNDCRANKKNA